MKTHKWSDIRDAKVGKKRAAQLRSEALAELAEVEASLAQIRKALGITQAQLAERAGLTQGAISKTESGMHASLETLRELIEALGGELDLVARFGETQIKLGA
ncbi:MAG: helix-turn-helix transcriptional regulator [Chrysiogenetes bacterium]|nr:helix-turn-helix transcriptional regulator [Chrysiogenetes bacterium]